MGSLKQYPILPAPPIPRPAPLPPSDTNSDGTSKVPAQPHTALLAGVFKLTHTNATTVQTYFGATWDSADEPNKQRALLATSSHPHAGITNSILSSSDLTFANLEYMLVYDFTLPPEFNLTDVSNHLSSVVTHHTTEHNRLRVVQLTKIYNLVRLRNAFPRFYAHTLAERELERFAAAVEMQKFGRIYIATVRVQRIRQYQHDQARLAAMAMYAPILARMLSSTYRGYRARARVFALEKKRREMRLLIKVQTRLRMILARNRRRRQKEHAQMWRAAKLVQVSDSAIRGRGAPQAARKRYTVRAERPAQKIVHSLRTALWPRFALYH